MKAAAINSFGGPEVVELLDVETPTAGPGQVRVRVKAAGIQAADCAVRGGWAPPGQSLAFPQKIGNEFAGVVDQVGEGAEGFPVGSEVLGWALLAGHAEYLVVPTDQIVTKPASMPWPVAGVFSASGQTAHTALERLKVGAGDTLLVHAAAGGVGTVAVQLAKAYGATVIGTAGPHNHDYLRSLGAVPVAYGEGLSDRVRELAPQGVTAALDGAGGDAVDVSVELVEDRDRIGTLVAFDRVEELGILGLFSQRSTTRLQQLVDLYADGRLRIEVSRTFPLAQAADAHRAVETRHVRGKIAIVVD
ncbi:NADP-dependent oxidoreductase [Streptomyces sp. NPDC059506]|uniref:NADP-dependent oxidoreductase n=1 Tax=Streptomyces TaxID=1883 RepID=UPI000CB3C5F6|nr:MULTISPECIES: NADP-dependent oxidoreductase [unclassified Streptomyces]MCZ2526314.1 NADP-dependent oxidoreductase [Streptomyces sp. HB2AG]PLW71505.1 alcohol dehydrogenase [Streptomyces sp. DJ]QMV21233.1 zinc-binding dehydrogenase [Streptomyces sp. SCUT-3]